MSLHAFVADIKEQSNFKTHDNTARVQCVDGSQAFLYKVLEITRQYGYPILINTSLNAKGKPIVNKKEDLNEIQHITEVETKTLKTGRTYYTPDGAYPSITTILGKTADNTWLQKWIERVGEEEAARVSKEATDRGTLVHEYAERHFNGEDVWDEIMNERLDVRQMSRDLIRATERGVEEVWGQEQVLWSNKYKYAGRTDMVGIWKGKPTIIDFKTSKKRKTRNR